MGEMAQKARPFVLSGHLRLVVRGESGDAGAQAITALNGWHCRPAGEGRTGRSLSGTEAACRRFPRPICDRVLDGRRGKRGGRHSYRVPPGQLYDIDERGTRRLSNAGSVQATQQ